MFKSLVRHRPSPAMVVASIALAVALGGTGYAAIKLPTNSVGNKQIKRDAVTGAKVKDFSLFANDFAAGQIPKGPAGAQGPAGAAGPSGVQGAPGASGVVDAVTFLPAVGPLPKTFSLIKKRADTDLIVTWSGSGFKTSANSAGAINVAVNGVPVGGSSLYFNQANVHATLPTGSVLLPAGATGLQVIQLMAGGSLFTDGGDQFWVTATEVKRSG